MTLREKRTPTMWKSINYVGRTYVQKQKYRIGTESRMNKMIEAELKDEGLMELVIRKDPYTKKDIESFRMIKPQEIEVEEEVKMVEIDGDLTPIDKIADWDEKTDLHNKVQLVKVKRTIEDPVDKQRIEDEANEVRRKVMARPEYQIMEHEAKTNRKEEELMLKKAKELYDQGELWKWCLRTKGLAEVAALTFLSFVNPAIATGPGKVWKYTGWTPGAKMVRGEQGNYSSGIKGRMYVIANNVFMQSDPYYKEIYNTKRFYYENRPDIIAEKETNKKSWKGHVHNRSFRFMLKILLSHALEIIRIEEGLEFPRPHRWYIPIKPDVTEDPHFLDLLNDFKAGHAKLLEELKVLWVEGDMEKYKARLVELGDADDSKE